MKTKPLAAFLPAKPEAAITVRMTHEVRQSLADIAEARKVSVNALVLALILRLIAEGVKS